MAKVLMAGAGTGQFLDFIDPSCLQGLDWTFTDVSLSFLELLAERAKQKGLQSFRTLVDNLEAMILEESFSLGILVLVLEHVQWELALKNLRDLPCERLLIVIQENPESMSTNVSPHRILPPSLVEASKIAGGHLIPKSSLELAMGELGYVLESERRQEVPDGKTMIRLGFRLKDELS